ncbi:MAG: hypothetical protein JO053_07265 [Acidobacteria bacterium]|nr:hypothetical protein [Acidobacteriota bacterium]
MGRLREAENEVELLRQEIGALENSAQQTEQAIDSLLVTMRSGSRRHLGNSISIEDAVGHDQAGRSVKGAPAPVRSDQIAYFSHGRGIPSISSNVEPISNRFSDRTITQSCTLLLREAGRPLHVNELYNLLVAGGMKFKGNNPTISIAVSLNRNRRFRKVDPGTFDLVIREAKQAVS